MAVKFVQVCALSDSSLGLSPAYCDSRLWVGQMRVVYNETELRRSADHVRVRVLGRQ